MTRSLGGLLAALALALATAGCVSLPESGGVQTRPEAAQVQDSDAAFDFAPSGPRRGAGPVEIVDGFLLAMQASPVSTATAREFLTDEASSGWVPERRTLIYGSQLLSEQNGTVTMTFDDTVQLDGRGSWKGSVGARGRVAFPLELTKQEGEWRITNPPDALIVPRAHFESRFEQYFLYFFDQTAQVLVPEPVYLPRGQQAPTVLVRRLLRGPDVDQPGVTRTFIPRGTELQISVPVARDGTAEVPLSNQVLDLAREDLQMVLAQLAWTLGQVPGVETMRITVDDAPLDIPGEGDRQSVSDWTEFDPAIHWASQELFGIRGGRVLALSADGEQRVEGRFAVDDFVLSSIAVDFPAEQVAAVTEDGSTVVLAPRARNGDAGASEQVVVYSDGVDLLRPSWDLYGQLWLVDRRRSGAQLQVIRSGVPTTLDAPGVSGEDVVSFSVSRDGTRLVAVVADDTGDRLVVARVVRSQDGRVRAVTAARTLPVGDAGPERIRDVGWRTPGSLVVLTGPTAGSSEVEVVLVDGSARLEGDASAEVFQGRGVRLVASPSQTTPIYLATERGQLFELASDGQWIGPRVKGGLFSPTFVG